MPRKMQHMVLVALPLLAAPLLAGPAQAAEQRFMVTGFEAIASAGPHKVIVTTGKSPSARAVGARDDVERLQIEVDNNTLRIDRKRDGDWLSWKDSKPVTIYVTATQLHSAKLAGSGDMAIDRMKGDAVKLNLAGSGDLNVGIIKADALDVSVTGSGDLAMTGTCNTAGISIAGSGNVEAAGLTCQSLTGKIAGSGNIKADVAKTADLKVMGSGDITITGKAKCDVKTVGSGHVSCGNAI